MGRLPLLSGARRAARDCTLCVGDAAGYSSLKTVVGQLGGVSRRVGAAPSGGSPNWPKITL